MKAGWPRLRPATLAVALALGAAPGSATPAPPAPSVVDADRDGYPDSAELYGADRTRFAEWFAAVAESQYYGTNADWAVQDQDCSGLVRYAFVNALSRHNAAWFAKFRYLPPPRTPSVQGVSYPLPVIGRAAFRVAPGAYRPDDVAQGRMVGRTGAQFLLNGSMTRVSRDVAQARRGDVLFFLRPQRRSYHSMVYLGGGMVVYHTGLSPAEGGEVRLLSVQTLMKHPDAAFHPVASNQDFLGVYRWKIVQ
ncbi:hypothetical protein HNQ07_000384 [Deinococcus metalli]|uniref:DUF1175 family protein n=1 Tax=Deinococcus metalli TaxID=1141878 RepID=A0A7W8KBL4_9DEIO|nr:DUF1175 family protein [Deinococcus metalli]MBB5374940.1 hypothetical protein [Deinococcus metalli]GHF32577.1 hypothetical protein GCM10017781_06590 [Deinococcus metalli]